jgi:hypothetical protein
MYKIEHYELSAQHPVACPLKAGCVVRVDTGRLWLTLQGRVNDVWLQTGEAWVLPVDGTLWLSAEPVARFNIAQPLARRTLRMPKILPATRPLRAPSAQTKFA